MFNMLSRQDQDLGNLADAWAAMAVRDVLEPDEDEILLNMARMLSRLADAPKSKRD